jgi:hypothetical protein
MYLKPASTSSLDVGLRKTLGTIFEPADYGVEKILAHRRRKNATEYLVQWESCSYLQSTWEPESGLMQAQRQLSQYSAKRRQIDMDAASVMLEDQRRLGRLVCDMREVNKWVRPVSSILPTWATQFM